MDHTSLAVIRVMTLPESANKEFSSWLEKQFPLFKIQSFAIENQPEGVHDPVSYNKAEPKIARLIQDLSINRFHAYFINCAEDPGIHSARQLIDTPIWGAGSSAACIAKSSGLPVGVIGLTKQVAPAISGILGDQIVASAVPSGVHTALDLSQASDSIIEAAQTCRNKGARCILLACTAMSLLGTPEHIRSLLNIPVIDPLLAPLATIQQLFKSVPAISVNYHDK